MRHTLSVLVENKPGALMRISSMFARRGFNIESLAVGPTERHDVSRITLRVDCEQHPLEQIEKQMHKLVNVLRVSELGPDEAVERERALLQVTAPAAKRDEIPTLAPEIQLLFKAKYHRPKDDHDFRTALPLLSPAQRDWLKQGLEVCYGQDAWTVEL